MSEQFQTNRDSGYDDDENGDFGGPHSAALSSCSQQDNLAVKERSSFQLRDNPYPSPHLKAHTSSIVSFRANWQFWKVEMSSGE